MLNGMRSACSFFFLVGVSISGAEPLALLSEGVHLGVKGQPEWSIFKSKTPASESLSLEFDGKANATEHCLVIRQSDVKQDWVVELNGKRIGQLHLMESDLVHILPVPPNALRDGANELKISTRVPEDVVLHEIRLEPKSRGDLLSQASLRLEVRENGGRVPARITVVDGKGFLAPLLAAPGAKLAVRPGVVYTGDGQGEVGVLPGDYTIYATRGPEYGLATQRVSVGPGETVSAVLPIQREVSTPGWVASDTHIHTLTLSRHGDATLQERMLTLAGEGVELPVCTEHNLHADYSQAAQALGLAKYFTAIAGNEVTTRKGHFNIFPVQSAAPPPDAKLEHWPDLMKAIRATPDVQVVVLNHPHDVHSGFTPMALANIHPATGRNLRGFDFSFDAMELINSGAMRSDWMEPVRTWFALLNRGYKITGVGASDSHDVSRFIVGQGRTYIMTHDANPGNLDVSHVCANLLIGRAVVSLGLFPKLQVDGKGPGELVTRKPGLRAEIEVHGATWMQATQVVLYANGIQMAEAKIKSVDSQVEKARLEYPLLRRSQDYFLVMIASGPGATEPFWGLARPYQPSSPEWNPTLIGITNPIWVDADGDGEFTSARGYAERLVREHGELGDLLNALGEFDLPVSVHVAELLEQSGTNLQSPAVREALEGARPVIREGFALYQEPSAR